MKNYILLGLGLAASLGCYAQEMTQPIEIENVYATNITPDGKYVGCFGASSSIYNTETGSLTFFTDCILGLGNAVSDDGTGVGYRNDLGVIMKDGDGIVPPSMRSYWMSSINAITPDGSRITGFVSNPNVDPGSLDFTDAKEPGMIPFYCDIDSEGNVGPVNILPYPTEDFFGLVPQMILAYWISEDGHTILSQMIDNYGRMADPIVYVENEDGVWDYREPTKPLFNPENIELPENPWTACPDYPEVTSYMSPESREQYEADWEAYYNGQLPEEPDPFTYMSSEEEALYWDAVEKYDNYIEEHQADFKAFDQAYKKILRTTPLFAQQRISLNSAGTRFSVAREVDDENGFTSFDMYIFNIEDGSYEILNSPQSNVTVTQILPDGTILAASDMMSIAQTFIKLPDEENFRSIPDYFAATNPANAEWLNANLANGCGLVSVNNELTTFAGAVLADHFTQVPSEDIIFATYVFTDNAPGAGVESLVQPEDEGTYKVYNLQGVKVVETTDCNVLNSLPKGIYIINGKKIAI